MGSRRLSRREYYLDLEYHHTQGYEMGRKSSAIFKAGKTGSIHFTRKRIIKPITLDFNGALVPP